MTKEFPEVSGFNVWAWGGLGAPSQEYWEKGDDYIGDPPHEDQNWYSVFSYDESTLDIF